MTIRSGKRFPASISPPGSPVASSRESFHASHRIVRWIPYSPTALGYTTPIRPSAKVARFVFLGFAPRPLDLCLQKKSGNDVPCEVPPCIPPAGSAPPIRFPPPRPRKRPVETEWLPTARQ